MTFKLISLICLLVQLCISCDYININGYGYPSGGCFSYDYIPTSFSYYCDTTSSFNLQNYDTSRCANGNSVIDSDTANSFNCSEYNTPNTCDVVEYENWLYAANCAGDIYVERKTYIIDTCFSVSNAYKNSSVMITCDMETITFTYYSDLQCSSISRTNAPYGESYRITKCGDQELDYCNEPVIVEPVGTDVKTNEKDYTSTASTIILVVILNLVIVVIILGIVIHCVWKKYNMVENEPKYNMVEVKPSTSTLQYNDEEIAMADVGNTNKINNGEKEGEMVNNIGIINDERMRIKLWFRKQVGVAIDNEGKQYYELFIENGFERLDLIKYITDSELKEIGVHKMGHRKAILIAAKKL